MSRLDPVLQLYRKGVVTTQLLLLAISAAIALLTIPHLYSNMRSESDRDLARYLNSQESAIRQQLFAIEEIAAQIASRTLARNTLIEFNAGHRDRQSASSLINDILSDVIHQSNSVVGVWRFDNQDQLLAGAGITLPADLTLSLPLARHHLRHHTHWQADGSVLHIVDNPIIDRNRQRAGNDIILFDSAHLLNTLHRHRHEKPAVATTLAAPFANQLRPLFVPPPPGDNATPHSQRTLTENGLTLLFSVDKSLLYDAAERELIRIILFTLTLLLIGSGTLWLIGRYLLQRMGDEIHLRTQREAELAASETRLRLMIENSPLPIMLFELKATQRITLTNYRFEQQFGPCQGEEATIEQWLKKVIPQQAARNQFFTQWQSALDTIKQESSQATIKIGSEFTTRNQQPHYMELAITRTNNHGVIIFTDLTQHQREQQKLALAASVFTHASEGITITDSEGTILDINNSFTDITGYTRDEVIGKNPRILKSGHHPASFYSAMWQDLLQHGHWNGEIRNRRRDGSIYVESLSINAVHDEEGVTRNYVGIFTNITAAKEQQQHLIRLAHYDALTKLPNRLLLLDRLQQQMAHTLRNGTQLAVAFIDLDGFKQINDQFGHEAGDYLLVTVANRLQHAIREGDTVSRLGGDEFVALLIEISAHEQLPPLLKRLLAAADEPIDKEGTLLKVSASIGITLFPQANSVDGETLLKQADCAMYRAKNSGKNRCCFYDPEFDTINVV
jgi:diguanylate cyclase (GGDEF)-like protein/PAS domain S-box-containing protein